MVPYLKYVEIETNTLKWFFLELLKDLCRIILLTYLVIKFLVSFTFDCIIWLLFILAGPIIIPLIAWFNYRKQTPIKENIQ